MPFVQHPPSTCVAVVGRHVFVINVCASSLEIASLFGEACVELLIADEVPERDSHSEKEYEIPLKVGPPPEETRHAYKSQVWLQNPDSSRRWKKQCVKK